MRSRFLLGAEIMVGDLLDLAAVGRVLEGVEAAYFCFPIEPGLVEATAYQCSKKTMLVWLLFTDP